MCFILYKVYESLWKRQQTSHSSFYIIYLFIQTHEFLNYNAIDWIWLWIYILLISTTIIVIILMFILALQKQKSQKLGETGQVSVTHDILLPTHFLDIMNCGRLLTQYINP